MTRFRLLAAVSFIVLMSTRSAAQAVPGSLETLATRVAVNDHLLVTLVDGSTREGRFDGVSPRGLSILGASGAVEIEAGKIGDIRKRDDSLRNGALWGVAIGGGVAAAAGGYMVALCANEDGMYCDRNTLLSIVVPLAVGLGGGLAIDAAHRGTTLVYQQPRLTLAPFWGRGTYGVQARGRCGRSHEPVNRSALPRPTLRADRPMNRAPRSS